MQGSQVFPTSFGSWIALVRIQSSRHIGQLCRWLYNGVLETPVRWFESSLPYYIVQWWNWLNTSDFESDAVKGLQVRVLLGHLNIDPQLSRQSRTLIMSRSSDHPRQGQLNIYTGVAQLNRALNYELRGFVGLNPTTSSIIVQTTNHNIFYYAFIDINNNKIYYMNNTKIWVANCYSEF